ncbi:hypothetical protein [Actinophytocola sediminis]
MDFSEALRAAEGAMGAAVTRAVQEAGEALLSDSRDVTPRDQGDLINSGKVTVAGDEAVVSYDTPYAARQHEDPELRHDGNGQANYLGGPLRANSQRYLDHIARRAGEALA